MFRTLTRHLLTVGAAILLLAILVVPADASPATLLRLPVEGLVALALVLAMPARHRPIAAVATGAVLGLWAVVRVADLGFTAVLRRPFDPVLDWPFLDAGVDVLTRSVGRAGAIGIATGAAVLAAAIVVVVALSMLRVSRVAARHRPGTLAGIGVLGVVWIVLAAAGARIVADEPVAARDLVDRLGQVRLSLADGTAFADELALDPYRETPGEELLTALRGKDVLFVLVESYGRVAVADPRVAAVLTDGTERLDRAGFGSRSAFLTSPTVSGGSWLAFATLLSGSWVTNQQRYQTLAASDRLALPGAFARAGWSTMAVMPGVTMDWPEGGYYRFDTLHTSTDLGYRGPLFSFDTIPDQYVLAHFQRTRPADPVMAVIPLISSHAPWRPVPEQLPWDAVGDGSGFGEPTEPLTPAESVWRRDPAEVRADYAHAIGYSLQTLISYVETYGDDDLVLVFLGDHQPAPVVTGETENRDSPITIVSRDPVVLDRVAGWGWTPGLTARDDAPVWRMDAFRDQFLSSFS